MKFIYLARDFVLLLPILLIASAILHGGLALGLFAWVMLGFTGFALALVCAIVWQYARFKRGV